MCICIYIYIHTEPSGMTHPELVRPVYGGYLRSCAYNLFKGDVDILGFWA